MARNSLAVLAAAFLATSAAAQVAPSQAPVAPPPLPPTAMGWSIEKDTGTCVLRKGGDAEPQIAITSRGRLMVSDPMLPDENFTSGQRADLTLRWQDGRVEAVEGSTLLLPGGGGQQLKARKAYIIPYDTLALAQRYKGAGEIGGGAPSGFILTVERGGMPMWSMDTSGSGPAMASLIECADSVMIKRVETPVVPEKKKRR